MGSNCRSMGWLRRILKLQVGGGEGREAAQSHKDLPAAGMWATTLPPRPAHNSTVSQGPHNGIPARACPKHNSSASVASEHVATPVDTATECGVHVCLSAQSPSRSRVHHEAQTGAVLQVPQLAVAAGRGGGEDGSAEGGARQAGCVTACACGCACALARGRQARARRRSPPPGNDRTFEACKHCIAHPAGPLIAAQLRFAQMHFIRGPAHPTPHSPDGVAQRIHLHASCHTQLQPQSAQRSVGVLLRSGGLVKTGRAEGRAAHTAACVRPRPPLRAARHLLARHPPTNPPAPYVPNVLTDQTNHAPLPPSDHQWSCCSQSVNPAPCPPSIPSPSPTACPPPGPCTTNHQHHQSPRPRPHYH